MGRYSSVQTFADGDKRVAPVPYASAVGGAGAAAAGGLRVPVVGNVKGSGTGVGSNAFHGYERDRRAEMERLRRMEETHAGTLLASEFVATVTSHAAAAEEKTRKRAAERHRRKEKERAAAAAAAAESATAGAPSSKRRRTKDGGGGGDADGAWAGAAAVLSAVEQEDDDNAGEFVHASESAVGATLVSSEDGDRAGCVA